MGYYGDDNVAGANRRRRYDDVAGAEDRRRRYDDVAGADRRRRKRDDVAGAFDENFKVNVKAFIEGEEFCRAVRRCLINDLLNAAEDDDNGKKCCRRR
ncbi:hypothetical protein [Bacillus infantis]|uniref:hypothetical protein n=1 Tax=Bacillus infantis TaxID=324767 RepID=UPI0021553DCE|nr:hypothetical protein [Bacillus infantis]MCR6612554.1 hypothetical protein [Bacillus infantis]